MPLAEHRIRTTDGIELALHRVTPAGGVTDASPLLLVAGTFNSRAFWLGGERTEAGVAWQLARGGFDVWILEPRGHGSSERPRRWLLTDWIEHDAPAAVAAVAHATGDTSVTWVGHSAGGVVGAAFAGSDHPAARMLRSLVLVGAPGPGVLSGKRRWLARAFHWVSAACGDALLPGERLKLGPEQESAPLVRQWLGWNLAGGWRGPGGEDYLARLGRIVVPVLAIAGAGDDLLAPVSAVRDLLERFQRADCTLVVAGRSEGMSRDYTHGGMVLARSAGEEIWPLIARWLARRQDAPELQSPEPSEQS